MENSAITPSETVQLFTAFARERRYTKGVSSRTEGWYTQSFTAFRDVWKAHPTPTTLRRDSFAPVVEGMIRRGVSPITINTYARAINAFLRWLHTEGKVETLTIIPRLKEPARVINTFGQEEIQRLYQHRPTNPPERRVHVLALLIADTGMRLNEALTLKQSDVDFENLLITIRTGKGGKQRVVPFGSSIRKILFKHVDSFRGTELVFCSNEGMPILQNNVRRDFAKLCKRLKIGGNVKGGFHVLRHGFATEYLRRGGDLIRLGRVLGHSNLEITRKYVHLQTSDLSSVHERLSQVGKAGVVWCHAAPRSERVSLDQPRKKGKPGSEVQSQAGPTFGSTG